ncbi:MAG: helix-turn-helix transcriptional regulator [Clostridia bacterium]|nr:helix-turn-helix transcriptional regulator [Clostridia bacterium]
METNLKAMRKERGLTQIALQMKTGIEQSLLSKYENGERTPPTEALIRLADFYGVSIDYLLCRTKRRELYR